jgi:hypothetical protein
MVMKYLQRLIWLALSAPVLALACSSGADDLGSGTNAIGGSQAKPAGSPGAGTSATAFATSNGFEVVFLGSQTNPDGTSTWRYRVNETPCAQDLSNWVLEVFDCTIVSASPEPNEVVRPDPNAKLMGVKWETGGGFSSGEFAVTVSGPARADTIRFAVKGPDVMLGETTGPRCGNAAAPPADPPTGSRGNKRCPDASVPRSDATPPPPPPPPVDAGSDGGVCTMPCDEGVQCPLHHFCNQEGCCQAIVR